MGDTNDDHNGSVSAAMNATPNGRSLALVVMHAPAQRLVVNSSKLLLNFLYAMRYCL